MAPSANPRNLMLGLAAFASLAFANGQHANVLLAWLAPVLVLRFVRTRTTRIGLLVAWAGMAAAWAFAWHAVFRASGIELGVAAVVFGGLNLVPYCLDRALWRRLPAWAGSLVFPSAWIAFEFGLASASPLGAWGMAAYTQADVAPVAQLAALAGAWGIGFLMAWTAAVANAVWDAPRAPTAWRGLVLVAGAALVSAVAFGAWRAGAPPPTASVRIALVLPPVQDNLNYEEQRADAIERHLHAVTREAARSGARLVAWPEDSFFAASAQREAVRARLAALAEQEGIVLAATYSQRELPDQLRYRNLSTLYSPAGGVLWQYAKSHAVPGYEAAHMVPGDGRIARAATPAGQVAGMICFDADHLAMLRQLRADDDLLLVPSDDWPAIEALHPAMLRLRAIEQGLPIARPAINGRSVVIDARGRMQSAPARAATQPWIVDLPLERLSTPYARTGDAFAWGNLVVLLVLVAWGATRRKHASTVGDRSGRDAHPRMDR